MLYLKENWVITDYLLRGYINLLVSPGAVGKSMLTLTEAISVASGRDLLDLGKVKQGNVVVINNEDDNDEIDRRIAAICQHFRIRLTDLENKLFIHSGYNERVVIANEIDRKVIPSLFTHKIMNLIESKKITLLTIDPFVSTHESNENDNNNIDAVINCYKKIAGFTGVAIRLVHHTRKSGGEADSHAGDVESARGASSLKDAARVCHTLSAMGQKAANDAEIEPAVRHRLVRIDDAKTNFSLSNGKAKWFYKESVQIANGEWLGVMRPYDLVIQDKPKEKTPDQRKAFTIHNIAHAALAKLGVDGGKNKATELKAEYQNLANCGSSKADNDFTLLPVGAIKSQRLNLNGKFYRIYQTREDKPKAPRYIHLQADE